MYLLQYGAVLVINSQIRNKEPESFAIIHFCQRFLDKVEP